MILTEINKLNVQKRGFKPRYINFRSDVDKKKNNRNSIVSCVSSTGYLETPNLRYKTLCYRHLLCDLSEL